VAFYELFNEPTLYFGQLGSMSWDEWKKINEDLIHLIRAYDRESIPLVAGFDWAYDLTPLLINPVDPEWFPSLFESWDTYKLTESGEFFKNALQGKVAVKPKSP
jgi:hypothetical protein